MAISAEFPYLGPPTTAESERGVVPLNVSTQGKRALRKWGQKPLQQEERPMSEQQNCGLAAMVCCILSQHFASILMTKLQAGSPYETQPSANSWLYRVPGFAYPR